MNITIRSATPNDCEGMYSLIQELATYEKAAQEVTLTISQFRKDGFGAEALYKAILAEHNNEIIGMALYYPRYSTWKGKTLYLEDLIISEKHRKNGLGRALFERVVLAAKKLGSNRLEWQVLDWNDPAIEFYKSINANFDKEWLNCQLNEKQILTFEYNSIKEK